jgi:hypothetical protein
VATSAPEVKVRASSQGDSHRWSQITKPLVQKAIKLAKAQRATTIEDGIERACQAPEQFVAQLLPVPERPSGCDHRIVTRPADGEMLFVQVIATCRYNWSCCTVEDTGAKTGAGYSLEGPLGGTPPTTSSTTAPTKQKR